jgi:hypothetical protein
MSVEYWPSLDPDEEDEEQIEAEDPTNFGTGVVFELVRLEIRLKHGGRVD